MFIWWKELNLNLKAECVQYLQENLPPVTAQLYPGSDLIPTG